VRVRGANRLDFVHRMSTGKLLGLPASQGRTTVFTTPIARMVDHSVVLAFDDSLLLLTGGGNQDKLLRWLRKYIFFNDDVQLSDESATLGMAGFFGEQAAGYAETLCPGASSWPRYTHRSISAGILVSAPPLQGAGFYLLGPSAPLPKDEWLNRSYEDLRIAAGYPAYPNEINTNYIPLEAGLTSAISFSKGCYVGQEIIARMESRGQIAKRLVRLECAEAAGTIHAGDAILVDGKPAGDVTSATSDGRIGLGYVRAAEAGQMVAIGASAVPARITALAGL
jgi:tRNA-modifying protein YgfZ